DYPDAFAAWNRVSSIGAYVAALGLALFFIGVLEAFWRGRKSEANPWGAGATTLEWTLPSPVPFTRSTRCRASVRSRRRHE
ncbi:MAG TPA: hypothetical protein VIF02_10450, partial [Methylocella sp.]